MANGVEVNFCTNIILKVNALLNDGNTRIDHVRKLIEIKEQAELGIKYIQKLDNPNSVKWHDVIAANRKEEV